MSDISQSRSLSCIYLNARNKRLDFMAMLSSQSPDIVVITETFLDDSILNGELFPDGYFVYRCD